MNNNESEIHFKLFPEHSIRYSMRVLFEEITGANDVEANEYLTTEQDYLRLVNNVLYYGTTS
jgi:predicted transcriptional regulator